MGIRLKSALVGVVAVWASAGLAEEAKINVGMLLPYSGVYAALGKEIDQGFVLALKEAGMTDRFNIIREDDEAAPPVGVAKTRKLVLEDKAQVLVGIVSSGVVAAVRDFVDSSKVPLIVSNAGNNEVTGEACSKYITRVAFSNAQVNRPMGKWLFDKGVKTAYLMAPDYAAGHQQVDAFRKAFEAVGGKIVGEGYTPFGKTQDFGPFLTTAQAAKPEAIYAFYAGGEAINFVKQYDSFGIKKTIPLYGSGFLTSQLYVNAEGAAATGIITALHYVPTLDTPENQAFVKAFSAEDAGGHTPSEYAVQGYDTGRALVEAVKAGATDSASITEALKKVKYTGPRGPLDIDPATNNIVQNVYIYETVEEGGKLTQKLLDTVPAVRDEPNGCAL